MPRSTAGRGRAVVTNGNVTTFTDLEAERAMLIAQREQKMRELGLKELSNRFVKAAAATVQAAAGARRKKASDSKPSKPAITRRSGRLQGKGPSFAGEVDENDKVVGAGGGRKRKADGEAGSSSDEGDESPGGGGPAAALTAEEQLARYNEERCKGQSRGEHDSNIGISCHFCRQKQVCTLPDCPRCSRKDAGQQCAGKSYCTRCRDPQGQLCAACLRVRYGESVAQTREAGWLCPHCYEVEHGKEHGWFCNSSFCMEARGWKPTGIAIRKALAEGFPSVAHQVQARYFRKIGVAQKYFGKVAGQAVGQSVGETQGAGQAEGEEAAVNAAAVEPGAE